jgi:ankyrin repeat protein
MSAYGAMKPVDILFAASATGDLPAVRKVLDDGLDINSASGKPGDNKTALVVAAGADQLQTVRLLVEKGAQLNPQKTGPSPALVAALQNGSLDCADYLMAKGAASDPLMQAAARGDKADIDKSLASGPSDFDKLKPLCEIAAVNGHQEIFAELYDAIRLLPDYSYWTASNGVAVKAIAHGHREIIEEMIKRDHNLARETSTRYAAAAAKTSGMREWLISKGFKVPEYTDNERLIDAADKGDLIQMQRLIKAGADVNYTGEGGWTPLTRAASSSRPGAVKLLLANKANPNSVKSPGWNYSALCMAKTTEIADMLYAAGANINAKLYGRDVPIISYVVSIGPNEMVQWFIDHGVDVAKSKGDGPISPTLLFEAGTPEIAGMLLDHGVDINFKDEEGMTAMFRIEQLVPHPSKIVQVLLDHGADPNMRAVDGYTPLMAARDGATVDVLIAAGADPKAKDDRGITAIGRYAPGADSTRLPALRRHSAIPDAKDNASMLRNAIMTHKTAEVQALLAAGADPNMQVGDTTISMLDTAIDFGQFQIADLLRKAGAKGAGLFSEAAAKGDLAQMKTLLDAGADVNENGPNAQTPLSFAVRRGQTASIQFLLDHGANPSLFDAYGMTPLQSATMASYNFQPSPDWSPIEGMTGKEAKKALTDILALLNKHKPDSNYRNPDGETALCRAAEAGDSIAFDLPTAGVNFNAQRNDGMTPLMMAIVTQPKNESLNGNGSIITTDPKTGAEQHFSGRGMIVKSLLAAGADLTLRNKAGKTALDLARENGNPEILALLQQSKTNHP